MVLFIIRKTLGNLTSETLVTGSAESIKGVSEYNPGDQVFVSHLFGTSLFFLIKASKLVNIKGEIHVEKKKWCCICKDTEWKRGCKRSSSEFNLDLNVRKVMQGLGEETCEHVV